MGVSRSRNWKRKVIDPAMSWKVSNSLTLRIELVNGRLLLPVSLSNVRTHLGITTAFLIRTSLVGFLDVFTSNLFILYSATLTCLSRPTC